jgi:hypothetical protein
MDIEPRTATYKKLTGGTNLLAVFLLAVPIFAFG